MLIECKKRLRPYRMLDLFRNTIQTHVVFEGCKFGKVVAKPIVVENSLIYGHMYNTIRFWCKGIGR